jgi:hypothetical protein
MRHLRTVLICLVVAILGCAACGDDGPTTPQTPQTVSVTGSWFGSMVTSFGAARTLSMTLQEADNTISGSYAIAVPDSVPYWTGTVQGERAGDSLSLNMPGQSQGGSVGTVEFSGEVTGANSIEGVLIGSGWTNTPIVLTRR